MAKRPATTQKATRKRRKGGTTYSARKLNLPRDDKMVEESVRILDVSTSERTGRVLASRRTVKHHHQGLSGPKEPAASKQPEVVEEVNAEEAGTLIDPDVPVNAEERQRKKSAKPNKDNDSVSKKNY